MSNLAAICVKTISWFGPVRNTPAEARSSPSRWCRPRRSDDLGPSRERRLTACAATVIIINSCISCGIIITITINTITTITGSKSLGGCGCISDVCTCIHMYLLACMMHII